MIYSADDIEALSRTLYGEARGDDWRGKVAVAWSILNRATIDLHNDGTPDWWGEGVAGVCRKPWQDSCWNANDPTRAQQLSVPPGNPPFPGRPEGGRGGQEGGSTVSSRGCP